MPGARVMIQKGIPYPRATGAIGGTLLALTAIAWMLTVHQASSLSMSSSMGAAGSLAEVAVALPLLVFLAMWVVMMSAMMLPSVMPMVLIYHRVAQSKARASGSLRAWLGTVFFVMGYFATWASFGLVAYVAGRGLDALGTVWPALATERGVLTGAALIVAGVYQVTPLKSVCLAHCRSPLSFLTHHWRSGRGAALRMGAEHGIFCVGCCWGLMLVLFAVGVMNLPWMGLLALIILAEKTLAQGRMISWAVAGFLMTAGVLAAVGHLPGLASTM